MTGVVSRNLLSEYASNLVSLPYIYPSEGTFNEWHFVWMDVKEVNVCATYNNGWFSGFRTTTQGSFIATIKLEQHRQPQWHKGLESVMKRGEYSIGRRHRTHHWRWQWALTHKECMHI